MNDDPYTRAHINSLHARIAELEAPPPCQGCGHITGLMTVCLGICAGMTCQEDADARAAVWATLPTTFALREGGAS